MNQLLRVRGLLCSIVLLFSLQAFAQLPAFTFNVSVTDQTCLGNGALNFTVSGTQPGATVSYTVYLLPDTTNPVITTPSTSVPGLVAGNYSITAIQTLNGQTRTNTKTATINNLIIPLTYTLTTEKVRCGNDGKIIVNVTSGYPSMYQITAGPVLKPLQPSNTFTGLPPGLYTVRVFDTCGEAVVVTTTVVQAFTGITIADGTTSDLLADCNNIGISHAISVQPTREIFYPLYIQITVFPPGGGAPIVQNQTVPTGPLEANVLNAMIPFYYDQLYSYNVRITDACGNVYNKNNNTINKKMQVGADDFTSGCDLNYFLINRSMYVSPVTVNFITAPPGFDPNTNIFHPVFASDNEIKYGGNGVDVPEGNYTVQVTDACNRSVTVNFLVATEEKEPEVNGMHANCLMNGTIGISIEEADILTVVITSGPAAYGPYPKNVSAFIVDGELGLTNVPPGVYTFTITDSCGQTTEKGWEVLFDNGGGALSAAQRPGCEQGFTSVRITRSGGDLNDLEIIAAPAGFGQTLPFDVSDKIAIDGRAYLNGLPQGSYTFRTTSACGDAITGTFAFSGYTVTTNNVEIIRHCGSFDVQMQHVSNGTYIQGFYLQKYDPVGGVWEHPATGVDYVEGTQASLTNSLLLTNNTLNLSFPYTGHFRILKTFFIYDNGTTANIRCLHELYTFDIGAGPRIIDAYAFPCDANNTEVAVVAEGIPPLIYRITEKDSQPFVVNNGQSNLFSGLQSAMYNFEVTDSCGNIVNRKLDIDALNPLSIEALGFCEGENSSLTVPQFSFLDYKWYKQGAPNTTLSTTGTLNFPSYNSAIQSGTYILSITTDNPLSCMNQELSYTLDINSVPDAGADITQSFCNNGIPVNLKNYLAAGIDPNGEWEDLSNTGLLTNSTLTTVGLSAGTYSFRYVVSGLCNQTDEAMVTLEVKDRPLPPVVNGTTPVCEGLELQLTADVVVNATYAWTGPNGFTSTEQNPLIGNVEAADAGNYTLIVTVNGCTSDPAVHSVAVIPAPKAGLDGDVAPLCNEGNVIDLTDYLSGDFDNGGTWEDMDTTGALNGSGFATSGIAEGAYQFRYSLTNSCNITDEAIITVSLKDIPQAPTLTPVTPVCEGTDVQLETTAVANATYAWTGPNGFTSTEQNPLLTAAGVNANGNYSLTVTVNDCTSALVTVPVTVNALPQFTVEGNTALCDGQVSSLTVVPDNFNGNAASYQWYLDGIQLGETTGVLSISQIGQYEVEVNNNDCVTSSLIDVELNDNPFELELDSGCINYDYMLWVANLAEIPGATVTWTGPQNFTFTGNEANITNGATGDYIATVTNGEGCTAEATITIDNTSCIIPKGISPNGDGLNDSFDLSNLDVIEIKIFNRYGLKVYEAQNYIDEWHGQSDKGELPTATYYYVITLSAGKQVTGWVYLMREEK